MKCFIPLDCDESYEDIDQDQIEDLEEDEYLVDMYPSLNDLGMSFRDFM